MSTIRELKEHIKNMPDDEPCDFNLWFKEEAANLREGGTELKEHIKNMPAGNVLETVHYNFDANYGICWENFESELDNQMEPTLHDNIEFKIWRLKGSLNNIFGKMKNNLKEKLL